jgi:peptidylprolyl isomerase
MAEKKKLLLAALLAASLLLIAGCAGQAEKTVQANDNVTVDYTGWLDDGSVFDTSDAALAMQAGIYGLYQAYEPISFVTGSGEVIEGFDRAIIGMKIGETKNFTLTPDQAYGAYNDSLIQVVPMEVLAEYNITPQVNDTLYYGSQPVRVVGIENNTSVYIDFNSPLAGKTLTFQVTVRDIQPVSDN